MAREKGAALKIKSPRICCMESAFRVTHAGTPPRAVLRARNRSWRSVPANVGNANLQNAVTRTQRSREAPAAFRYLEERVPPRSAMATKTQPISAAPRRSIPSATQTVLPAFHKSDPPVKFRNTATMSKRLATRSRAEAMARSRSGSVHRDLGSAVSHDPDNDLP